MIAHVRAAAERKLLFLPHAVRQMLRPSRLISTREVRKVLEKGSIIEDYPDDPRGHSCLMLGFGVGGAPRPRGVRTQGRLFSGHNGLHPGSRGMVR